MAPCGVGDLEYFHCDPACGKSPLKGKTFLLAISYLKVCLEVRKKGKLERYLI